MYIKEKHVSKFRHKMFYLLRLREGILCRKSLLKDFFSSLIRPNIRHCMRELECKNKYTYQNLLSSFDFGNFVQEMKM